MGREKTKEEDDWKILCRKVVPWVEKLCEADSATFFFSPSPFPPSLLLSRAPLPLPFAICRRLGTSQPTSWCFFASSWVVGGQKMNAPQSPLPQITSNTILTVSLSELLLVAFWWQEFSWKLRTWFLHILDTETWGGGGGGRVPKYLFGRGDYSPLSFPIPCSAEKNLTWTR